MRSDIYGKVLSMLPETVEWSAKQNLKEISEFLLARDGLPRVFLGSGGSLSAACAGAELSVSAGMPAVAMTPYQFIFSGWSKLPAKVLALSAGGRNIDVINAYCSARQNHEQTFGVLLMSCGSTLEKMMVADGASNRFVYGLPYRDCFLATNSLVAFYLLLFRIYRDETISFCEWNFEKEIEAASKEFIGSTYNLPTTDWNEHDAALYGARETDRFYVLYSPEVMPVAVDLESRFSEGSVGCIQISDYRNFAHGRFNWFYQRVGQTAIIALVTPESRDVANGILSELPDYIPVMRLETNHHGSKGIMELLFKGMFLSKFIGSRWGLDIGAPKVAEFGRIIHNKNFISNK